MIVLGFQIIAQEGARISRIDHTFDLIFVYRRSVGILLLERNSEGWGSPSRWTLGPHPNGRNLGEIPGRPPIKPFDGISEASDGQIRPTHTDNGDTAIVLALQAEENGRGKNAIDSGEVTVEKRACRWLALSELHGASLDPGLEAGLWNRQICPYERPCGPS